MAPTALACTGDPLLNRMLAGCRSIELRISHCESVAEALKEARELSPAILFTSPALGDVTPLAGLKGVRLCHLVEQSGQPAPDGIPTLVGEPITPEMVDAWVRRPVDPPAPAVPPPPPLPRAGSAAPQVAPPHAAPPHAAPSQIISPQATPFQAAPHRASSSPRVAPQRPAPPRPAPPRPALSVLRQQVIAFWGGKPGAGRSTLAVALADLLSRAGSIRVCAVDLNPFNSSLAALVGKEQEASSWLLLSEALVSGRPFPADSLRWVRKNWAVITGPDGRAEWTGLMTRETVAWIVDSLRAQFDYIILDPEVRPGPIAETAVRLAQTVLLTVSPDYPDVLDTARAFEAALAEGWLDRGRCRLLLNRWVESSHLPAADVSDCFSLPVSLTVPASPETAAHASSRGVPITGLELPAALAQAFRPLVGLVAEPLVAAAPERRSIAQVADWFRR
jgi:Mrp family chromosome partitioning ATPase